LLDLYRYRGINIIRGDEVRAFRGQSRIDSVELQTHGFLPAGLVVVGIGVRPAVSFLAGSGVALEDGILVDAQFQTHVPAVYAAGDVARFFDPLFGRRRRIEHWSNATYLGSQVGKILAGGDGAYDTVSTFFTESFGVTLKVFGDPSEHDDRITRGSFAAGNAIVFYLERGRLAATLHTGQDEETEQRLKNLIRLQADPGDLRLLADETVPLEAAFTAAEARERSAARLASSVASKAWP
jgi:NADPH-dependent 2,4-dienoyl-CoA reductase/sulfur reductase-like enzyme